MASRPDAVPADELESLLTCSICLETFDDPRTLPCFHSFCKCCLETFVKKQRVEAFGKEIKGFNCPTCRSLFTLKPNEEVEGMSGSHFIRNMLDVMAFQRRGKVAAKCFRCEKSATCRCVTCEIFLCEKCLEGHESFPYLRKHTVLSIDQLSEPENQAKIKGRLYCKEHINKKLKFYCETCKELICRYCMDFNHVRPNHSCSPVEKVAEKQKEALKSSLKTLEETLVKGNKKLQAILNATQTLQSNAMKAKNKINKQAKELKKKILQKLDEEVQMKLDEVDKMYNSTHEKLAGQSSELEFFLDKVKGSVDLSKNLLEKGNYEEILSTQRMMDESVEKAKKDCPKITRPVHDGKIEYRAKQHQMNNENLTKVLDIGEVVCQPATDRQQLSILLDASVIFEDDEYVHQVMEWLKHRDFKWRLCYRGSRDGWKPKDFHLNCDNKGPTVTIVKANDNIFGGYTDQDWDVSGGAVYKPSKTSFLFSIKNKDNLAPFKANIQTPKDAILAHDAYGALFGVGAKDLCIGPKSIKYGQSHSEFGNSYKLAQGGKYFPAGNYQFTPSEIEVFF